MQGKLENQNRRILVVDDDRMAQRLVQKALEFEGYRVELASTGQEALDKVRTWKPHLVLLDVNMPELDGIETLKYLRQQPEYISTLFVSGRSKIEDVVRGLDAGADDYVTKPFDVVELLARVRSQLRIKDLHDNLTEANQKLLAMVDIDDLTGLFNMRSLYQKLQLELDRASRYGRRVGVVMMDMDHFKSVNDENDHLFGSFVLSEVGKIIRANIRKVDFAARYGGDEFLIVLTEIELEGAEVFTRRLKEKIAKHPFKNDLHCRTLTSSIGFAITDSSHPVDAKTLVRFADRALYEAKEGGRNTIRYYDFRDEANHPEDPTSAEPVFKAVDAE